MRLNPVRDKIKLVGLDLMKVLPSDKHNLNFFIPEAIRGLLRMVTTEHDSNIYRINISGGVVDVICIGMEKVDAYLEGVYDGLDKLPQWMQERIAILSMLSAEPPTEDVVGVGRRISVHTYWVYRPHS